MKYLSVSIQMKAIEQDFAVVLITVLNPYVWPFKWKLRSCGTVHYAVQGGFKKGP